MGWWSRCCPVPEVGVDRELVDPGAVGAVGDGVVVCERLQLSVELQGPVPPVIETDLAAADTPQPVGWLALDRQGQVPGGEQLDALEAEPGTVHRVLGVVAECLDELGALPAAAAPSRRSAWAFM